MFLSTSRKCYMWLPFLFLFIKYIKKAINALGNAFHHQIAGRLDSIPNEIETVYIGDWRDIFSLRNAIDRPFTAIGSHREYAAVSIKSITKEHTQIRQRQRSLFFDVITLNHLMSNNEMLTGGR